jgi:hypothetical protein
MLHSPPHTHHMALRSRIYALRAEGDFLRDFVAASFEKMVRVASKGCVVFTLWYDACPLPPVFR